MIILGINAYHGDAAAALIRDGRLIAAAEEERFNRIKHSAGFPSAAIRWCLQEAGIDITQVDHVGISRDPSAHLHKKVLFAATRAAKQVSRGRLRGSEIVETVDIASSSPNGKSNDGTGMLQQVRDRLQNAARVRDLKDELARLFEIPKAK